MSIPVLLEKGKAGARDSRTGPVGMLTLKERACNLNVTLCVCVQRVSGFCRAGAGALNTLTTLASLLRLQFACGRARWKKSRQVFSAILPGLQTQSLGKQLA